MPANNITSANAVIMLSIPEVFSAPQQIQGFSAENVFSTDQLVIAETQMGVDGQFAAGFVFVPIPQRFSLMASSPSVSIFDAWYNAMQTALSIIRATAVIQLPAIDRKWTMLDGVLTGYPLLPDAGRVLAPRQFTITWGRAQPAPV